MTWLNWTPRLRRGRWLLVVMLAACGAALGGCARSVHHSGDDARSIDVVMQNFKIDIPRVIHAGRVRFVVRNSGPSMHEFNVVRTSLAAADLPKNAAGTVADTDPHPGFKHLGEVEGIDIGQRKTLTLTLLPGDYVVYCNMDGHYEVGMAAKVTVVA
jgi:uncharacterized cupredoxin-like copper-binding protein